MKAPGSVGPSVRTTFRRTLAFAGVASGAAFAVMLLYQLAVAWAFPERALEYESWAFGHGGGFSEPPDFILAGALALAGYAALMGMAFGKPKGGFVVLALTTAVVLLGQFSIWLLLYCALAAGFLIYCAHCWLVSFPLERVEEGNIYSRAFWRHFRFHSFVWLFLSGWLLYYSAIMGFFLALDFGLHGLFWLAGAQSRLRIFAQAHGTGTDYASAFYTALLAAGMMFYHFICSSYLVNQLDYLVDAGKDRIRHRGFWWPFKRASSEGKSAPTGTAAQETSAP